MIPHKRPKIVCIGLDSMDKDLVMEWANAGHLPNFADALKKSTWGLVQGPAGMTSGCIWPSFITGLLPGHHAQYSGWFHFDSETYTDSVVYKEKDLKWPPFWDKLAKRDRKFVLYDAPFIHKIDGSNGIVVADWGTHDKPDDPALYFRTNPGHLAQEIMSRFGGDKIGRCDDNPPKSAEEYNEFVENLIERARNKSAISQYLLDSAEGVDWDFFFVTFYEAHCVGHHCWHLHDPTHHEHDPSTANKVGDPLLRVYSQIDSSIGEILSRFDEDTIVFICSNEGITAMYTGTNFLDDILVRIESHNKGTSKAALRHGFQDFLRPLWRSVPRPIRDNLSFLRRSVKTYVADREHREYFEILYNNTQGAIRLNLIGRERNGCISRTNYDSICDELIADLKTFKNRETGQELFRSIMKTSDVYKGEFLDELPDILVTWNRAAPIRWVTSPKFGSMENPVIYKRSGDHVPIGFFLAFGPNIVPQALNRMVSPIEFAPTFAHLLDLEQDNFDGATIPELIGAS